MIEAGREAYEAGTCVPEAKGEKKLHAEPASLDNGHYRHGPGIASAEAGSTKQLGRSPHSDQDWKQHVKLWGCGRITGAAARAQLRWWMAVGE